MQIIVIEVNEFAFIQVIGTLKFANSEAESANKFWPNTQADFCFQDFCKSEI